MCAVQDFFETRLLSMDTDFRVLSAGYLGGLPGIDIAQVRCMPAPGSPAWTCRQSKVMTSRPGKHLPLTALHGDANSHSS